MLKRHKALLGILLESPGLSSRTNLMMLAFLLRCESCLDHDQSLYDFVAYKHYPYSFTLHRDLEELKRLGYLGDGTLKMRRGFMARARRQFESLDPFVREAVRTTMRRYGLLSLDALSRYVEKAHPWFRDWRKRGGKKRKTRSAKTTVYTAGYEGKSVDRFFQELLGKGIQRVLDVRSNPVSRKYGFSKKALTRLCGTLDVDYVHMPELGVPASWRSALRTPADYRKVLSRYGRVILPRVAEARLRASHLVKERPTALVCFEADARYCHRGLLARTIALQTRMSIVDL